MTTPIKTLQDKIVAIFFAISLVLVCMCLFLCIRCLDEYHIYSDNGEYAKQYQLRVETKALSDEALNYYYCVLQSEEHNPEYSEAFNTQIAEYKSIFSKENSNMFFEIEKENGETVAYPNTKVDRGTNADFQYSCSYPYMINYLSSDGTNQTEQGIITCYVASLNEDGNFPAENEDGYSIAFKWIDISAKSGILLFILLAIVAIAAAILVGILLYSIGTFDENGKIVAKFIDKIPLDLYTMMIFFMSLFAAGSVKLTHMSEETLVSQHSVILIVTVVVSALAIAYLISVASRIKMAAQTPGDNIFKNTLIYKLISFLRRKLGLKAREKRIPLRERRIKKVNFGSLTTIITAIKFLGCLSLVCFAYLDFAHNTPRWGLYICIWIIGHAIITPLYVMLAFNLDRLKKSWQKLAEGDIETRVDISGMFGIFKDISRNLEEVRIDISRAYEKEAKSQRVKNEVLANVSHDIKTPLTSIVSNVALLKNEENLSDEAKECIKDIENQSKRLKTLLDNIIEASKVSAGDVKVNYAPTDVKLLLEQTAAEYESMLRENNLDLKLELPEDGVHIYVDGLLIWRVFENLMGNICKYSMEMTPVILSLTVVENTAIMSFKNTSKFDYSDVSSDRLTERFSRGDSSRHTDGNGLGLSIAKSLTEMQNGSFNLSIDGSLFCVVITFDIYPDVGYNINEQNK